MASKLNSEAMEKEAKATALKHICNMLQRPDQLEKIDQLKRRVKRNINSKEGMLKTAMQTQLDGVKTGLIHLKTAQQDIVEIKKTIADTEEQFPQIPLLFERLKHVREESMKHSQYAVSMENLKNIFDVPETVARTRDLIQQEKLLDAHKNLAELEKSRDDLLYELHRLAPQNNIDKNMLKAYYAEVDKLSEELGQQLWLFLRKTLHSVRTNPHMIVNVLRIIEREELSDLAAVKRLETSGFSSQGRPKYWRKRVFDILEEEINDRIMGCKLHERTDGNVWLSRNLEVLRIHVLEDLKVVKSAYVSCFPQQYDIVRRMLKLYHKCISIYLQEQSLSLEGNEYILLLNWVNAYEGPELLGHPDLRFSISQEGLLPLLSLGTINEITAKYLDTVKKNYETWLSNTISHESKDWKNVSTLPETDDSNHYQTTTPMIVFRIIDQHIQVTSSVSVDLVNRVLDLSMDHLNKFGIKYKESVREYAKMHFENRTHNFTPNMIAIANNGSTLMDSVMKFQQQYKNDGRNHIEKDSKFSNVVKSFDNLRKTALSYLIKEVLLDVDLEINKVGSNDWLAATDVIENVRLTLMDYFSDYRFLKNSNLDTLKGILQNALAKSYITAILTKKMQLKPDSQMKFAEKCKREARILSDTIDKLPTKSNISMGINPFEVIKPLMEFLILHDLSMLYLEISGLLKDYPDIKPEHFAALLSLREDMKTGAKKKVDESWPDKVPNSDNIKTIFSEIAI